MKRGASLVVQMVKHLPAIWETRVRSLGWEDPLEKEMAPLQYSCLGNPMDGGAWPATVQRVTISQMQLSVHTHDSIFSMDITQFQQRYS